jgi:CBS domain-containing membrane protein
MTRAPHRMDLSAWLHSPGGAYALLAVLSQSDFGFATNPVFIATLIVVLVGVADNRLMGRRYPHALHPPTAPDAPTAGQPARLSSADLDAALAHYDQVLDISRDDLQELLHYAQAAAYERRFGDLRCRDIMASNLPTLHFGTPLSKAWRLMRPRQVKALPATDKSEVMGQIMTRQERVTSADRYTAELLPLLSDAGHHHMAVLDDARRVVGIITQSDLIRALYRTLKPV